MKKHIHLAWISGMWTERKGLILLLFVLTFVSSAVAVTLPYLSKLLLDLMQSVIENPAYSSGAKPSSLRPCTTI